MFAGIGFGILQFQLRWDVPGFTLLLFVVGLVMMAFGRNDRPEDRDDRGDDTRDALDGANEMRRRWGSGDSDDFDMD